MKRLTCMTKPISRGSYTGEVVHEGLASYTMVEHRGGRLLVEHGSSAQWRSLTCEVQWRHLKTVGRAQWEAAHVTWPNAKGAAHFGEDVHYGSAAHKVAAHYGQARRRHNAFGRSPMWPCTMGKCVEGVAL